MTDTGQQAGAGGLGSFAPFHMWSVHSGNTRKGGPSHPPRLPSPRLALHLRALVRHAHTRPESPEAGQGAHMGVGEAHRTCPTWSPPKGTKAVLDLRPSCFRVVREGGGKAPRGRLWGPRRRCSASGVVSATRRPREACPPESQAARAAWGLRQVGGTIFGVSFILGSRGRDQRRAHGGPWTRG